MSETDFDVLQKKLAEALETLPMEKTKNHISNREKNQRFKRARKAKKVAKLSRRKNRK
jgi:hypothetical protein